MNKTLESSAPCQQHLPFAAFAGQLVISAKDGWIFPDYVHAETVLNTGTVGQMWT